MGQRYSEPTNTENIDEKDIIIAVVGQTGTGKTTFINVAAGKDILTVGRGLKPQTREIQHVKCTIIRNNEQQRVIFVDTPGFDSGKKGEVKKKLARWLRKVSSKKLKIHGILYLHRITDVKLSSPPAQYLSLMKTLCEESFKGFPNRLILVTTMWDKLKQMTAGEVREQELQKYWDKLPLAEDSAVSRVMRFDGSPESVESIAVTLMGCGSIYSHMGNGGRIVIAEEQEKETETETERQEMGRLQLKEEEEKQEKYRTTERRSPGEELSMQEADLIIPRDPLREAPDQSAKGENIFRSILFGFGRRKPSEPIPLSDSPSHETSYGNVVQQNNESLKESDTLIALMGPTGAGKSSFISTAANRDIGVAHDLQSGTAGINTYRIRVPGEDADIVLVDTPGFDDTRISDYENLKMISNWLEETGVKNIRLDGVLYLHRISDNRMVGTPLRNLELFQKLCGPKWFHRVVLVTTMWDTLLSHEVGERREEELRHSFWREVLKGGSRLERYSNSHESAWHIIKSARDDFGKDIKKQKQSEELKSRPQKETDDEGRALSETNAGYKLYEQLHELQRQRKELIRSLDQQIDRLEADDKVGSLLRDHRDQLKLESEAAERHLGRLKGGLALHTKLKSRSKAKEMLSA